MRLVCPNCGAQYEIDDRVIPDAGRDVQCSSCGHAWYQMPASAETADEAAPIDTTELTEAEEADEVMSDAEPDGDDTAPADDADADDLAAPEPAPMPVEPAEPVAEAAAPGQDDSEYEDDDDMPLTASPEGAAAPRRELDDSLRAILQEERAREMAARAADGGADMLAGTEAAVVAEAVAATENADEPAADVEPDAEPDTITTGDDEGYAAFGPIPGDEKPEVDVFATTGAAGAAGAAADKASRGRDLFPDIEEINSTLDSHGTEEEYVEEPEVETRSGFGRAFFAIIFLAALALALYLVAPKLAESVPALAPALSGYVDAVNGARAGLEGLLQGVTDQIDGATE